VKLIFWIEKNDFSRNLFEKILKAQGYNFYGLSSVEDFSYLIKDLSPDLIVVETKTALLNKEHFQAEYEKSDSFLGKPVVFIGSPVGLEFIKQTTYEVTTPVKPFEFPEFLKKILSDA